MIYTVNGEGKRRFIDVCDILEATHTLKRMRKKIGDPSEYQVIKGVIQMLGIIRKDLGVGRECIIEIYGKRKWKEEA